MTPEGRAAAGRLRDALRDDPSAPKAFVAKLRELAAGDFSLDQTAKKVPVRRRDPNAHTPECTKASLASTEAYRAFEAAASVRDTAERALGIATRAKNEAYLAYTEAFSAANAEAHKSCGGAK